MSPAFVIEAWFAWVDSLPSELVVIRSIGGVSRKFPKWIPEVFDCDNIARDFGVFLDRCMAVDHAKNGTGRGNAESGLFKFSLNGDPAKRHARTWVIDHDRVARVFDAGDGDFHTLNGAELNSITEGESV